MAFHDGPIRQDPPIRCCSCEPDIQRPRQGITKGRFGEEIVIKQKQWCMLCGRELSQADIDKYFPAVGWTNSR